MTKRRGHGEGSIFQRRDGRWVGRIDLGHKNGSRHRKDFFGKTRREAAQKLAIAQRTICDGLPISPERAQLGAFLNEWLENTARPNVRPRTYRRYRELVHLHVIPSLGKRPINRISPQELQALYNRKLEQGLAPRTVGHIHRVLHKALQDALRWGLVARNVTAVINPPKVPVREMHYLSPEQARQLLKAAEGDPLEALYRLALTTGLRQGEILGLKWPDLDWNTNVIHIRRTITRDEAGKPVEGEPKSAKSRRTVHLPQSTIVALRRHRHLQMETQIRALAWEHHNYIFTNQVGRPIDVGYLARRSFQPLLERAGLPKIRFHDLRHTAATLLLTQGVHVKVVSEMLGHSQISLTLDTYSHVISGLQEDAAEKIERLLTA